MGKFTKKTTDCGEENVRRLRDNPTKTNLPKKNSEAGSTNRLRPKTPVNTTTQKLIRSKLRSPSREIATNKGSYSNMVSTKSEKKGTETMRHKSKESTKSKGDSDSGSKSKTPLPENKETAEKVDAPKGHNEETLNNESNGNQYNKTDDTKNKDQFQENGKSGPNGNLEQNGKQEEQEPEVFSLELEVEVEVEDNCEKQNEISETQSLADTEIITIDDSESTKALSQSDTENGSVLVIESTSSVSESNNVQNNKESQNDNGNDDPASYDSNILLKDVKVTLNDCLKDPKAAEANGSEYAHKDLSFGRTLRTLSGRRSLSRMRNITVRDRQPSPNSSLFVNTSDISLSQEPANDIISFRHRAGAQDLNLSNGNFSTRKRKECDSEIESTNKRSKIEEETNSILNSSIEYIKSFRRPAQQSTPCKVQEKISIEEPVSQEIKVEESPVTKKWCIIM